MTLTQKIISVISLFLLLSFHAPIQNTFAESAIKCHCFKDRTYNPLNPTASDDYILATSLNSFLSGTFNIPKKQVVMLKMKGGVGQNDLLIGLEIAKVTGKDLQQLLDLKREKKNWSELISGLSADEQAKISDILNNVQSDESAKIVSGLVADEHLAGYFKVPLGKVKSLRASGLNEKEIALVLILADTGSTAPETIVLWHNRGGKSWSQIAHSMGIEPAAAGQLILNYPAGKLLQ